MSRRSSVRAVALAAFLIVALARPAAPASPDFSSLALQPYAPAKAAPEFALPDLAGTTRTLAEFKGRVLLLFFWATW
jgi:cytochrome oxidase Cu insertion factor (SCO1/SenC/PrrC family)